jgi:hypothetical protein
MARPPGYFNYGPEKLSQRKLQFSRPLWGLSRRPCHLAQSAVVFFGKLKNTQKGCFPTAKIFSFTVESFNNNENFSI